MKIKMRLFTALVGGAAKSRTKHYHGLPPSAVAEEDTRVEMGRALFLLIEELDSGVGLYRYDNNGECVGDTWHANTDDAKHQAAYEYQGLIKGWGEIPSEVEDSVLFGLALARASREL